MLPVFLAKYKEKVLHSGKYLNVIRECGTREIKCPFAPSDGNNDKFINIGGLLSKADNDGDVNMEDEEQNRGQYDSFEPIDKAYEWSSS